MTNKPDMIKAALSVGKFNTSDANLGSTKKGYAVLNDSVYTKEIWNAAIEAAADVVNTELGVDAGYVEKAVRKLKK